MDGSAHPWVVRLVARPETASSLSSRLLSAIILGNHVTSEPRLETRWLEEDTSSTLAAPPSWWRSRSGIVLLALGGVSFAAYRYDQASSDRILPGVSIAGTDVGGMTRAEAMAAVRTRRTGAAHAAPDRSGRARGSGRPHPLSSVRRADVAAAVDQALQASESVGFVTRVWHRLREEPVGISVDLDVHERRRRGSPISCRASPPTSMQTPRDASVSVVDGQVTFVHSRPGHCARRQHRDARDCRRPSMRTSPAVRLPGPDHQAEGPGREDRQDDRRGPDDERALLYDGFELERSYHVATAAAGYVTPPGEWTIIDKRENPTWTNPAPDTWGADLPAFIPAGPGNPLGHPCAVPRTPPGSGSTGRPTWARSARTPPTGASGC